MRVIKYTLAFLFGSVSFLSAQTPAELKSWLPAIDGWTISDKVEVFNPDDLFDRIDGAAPLYIENNFREMTSMEYDKGDDYITIQAYRHATPEDAFGMYAAERSPDLKFFPVGGEAQGDDAGFFFFAGDMYIKISSNSSENVSSTMQTIAKSLAKSIDPGAGYPPVIKALPKEGMEPYTEAYITANYIGQTFLNSVYLAKYKANNEAYQVFIIDAKTAEGAKNVLTNYFTFTKQPLDFAEGNLLIKDRYNGDIPAIWKGRYIIGIYSENGSEIANANGILAETAKALDGI
jgi:hypothetical protein